MLDAGIKQQLQAYLEKVQKPIVLKASTDQSKAGVEMQDLLEQINSMSDKISLENAELPRTPSFSVERVDGSVTGVAFAGVPLGHEFTSLVLALLQVGGHPPKAEQAVLERIRGIEQDLHFETFVSLSCHNCPDVVQALNLMSVINPRISHTMIEGGAFQAEVDERNVMAVPTVFLNGEEFGGGRMTLEEIVAKVDTAGNARQAEAISAKDAFDVTVIGGGPAGAAAAVYMARKGLRTGMVAERMGGQLMDTMSVENFISVKETQGPTLAAQLEAHVRHNGVDVMNQQRVSKLHERNADGLVQMDLDSGATLRSNIVIVATGARWRMLNVPGEKEYTGKGVAYCPHCDGPLFKGKKVAVVGGGNSGVEAAIDLAGIVQHVTLLEFGEELRADEVLQRKLHSLSNATVITQAATTEISGNGTTVNGLSYKDRATDEEKQLELDGVFVQIGLLPNTDWLKGTLDLTRYGEIEVDAHGATSMAGVYAAGDVTTVPFKQIVIASGDGAKAALGAFDYMMRSE